MKNLSATLAFLLLMGQVFAQITVTNATFPAAGDTLRYQTDPNPPALNLGTAGGGNQMWDFGALQVGPVQPTAWLAAAGGNGAANFPSANLRTGSPTSSVFYRKTSTALENLGTSGADLLNLGLNTTIRYQPPLPERRAPQKFFDIHTVESDLNWAVPTGDLADSLLGQLGGLVDSFRFRIHTTRLDVVDAWGTCQIPGGVFPVLREKRTTTTETSIDVHSFLGWTDLSGLLGGGGSGLLGNIGKDTTVAYHFFSGTEKEEIAVVTMNNTATEAQSVRFKHIAQTVAAENVAEEKPALWVSPNPGFGPVEVRLAHFPAGEYLLHVHDAQGKLVFQKNIGTADAAVQADLSAYAPGLFFFQVLNAEGRPVAAQKVVRL